MRSWQLTVVSRQRLECGYSRNDQETIVRTRYDAEKTLAAFAATARDETDLDALLGELVRVIEEAMQPETVRVWLRSIESNDAQKDIDKAGL